MMSNISLSGLLVALIALAGVVLNRILEARTWAGYESILSKCAALPYRLRKSARREDGDVVLCGNYQGRPVGVRFSQSEFKPAVNLQMGAPATITVQVLPRTLAEGGQRTGIVFRSGDSYLDSAFRLQSKRIADVRIFELSGAVNELKSLCRSRGTVVSLGNSRIELGLSVAPEDLGTELMSYLEGMALLSDRLAELPGADKIRIARYRPKTTSWITRVAMAAGAVAAIASVFFISPPINLGNTSNTFALGDGSTVNARDAAVIPTLANWRLATEADFDADFLSRAHYYGQDLAIPLRFHTDNTDPEGGRAYIFSGADGAKRIAIIIQEHLIYDARYEKLAGVARISNSALEGIAWQSDQASPGNGDGLLILPDSHDPSSAFVLVFAAGHLNALVPENYLQISLH
jgi:hypothetical protein